MSANNQPGVPMLLPEWLERAQIKYINPLMAPIARFLPSFATVTHYGRTSGTKYETTVNAFRKGNVVSIALIHGKTNWTKNVIAAGGADITLFGGRQIHVVNPRIVEQGQGDPALTRATRQVNKRAGVFVADVAQ
ncbi:deazaflavin-dependent nitroreductase family protein [Mycobacteroides abscessus subsp. bolletii]|nr:deazaflavin-dependent nitroreductase family protein [Mycobacteroides abscessus subsp. bolletii]SKF65293.1 deazaflavin-dependent nitroreductase family protein [Mycobacteroides abscessus subsp. bolletii]SKF94868.1 deazaflavin-dependent nitroreductase family protein [Mycobacteroides abscessus subsp. bolletii]SKG50021.1 deazaflavin-dependent nitroreductase family protein [Mycobacteroides abscessus subsp. bolletii]SKG62852.1 deazaflavin-dependent nitroreductase family protein [Mycobacteroides abs